MEEEGGLKLNKDEDHIVDVRDLVEAVEVVAGGPPNDTNKSGRFNVAVRHVVEMAKQKRSRVRHFVIDQPLFD